jgi:bile acid:Na+ symporter, BASS family
MFDDPTSNTSEILVGVFVILMMLNIGIDLTIEKIRAVFREPKLLAIGLGLNYIVVPAVFYGLVTVFDVDGMWAVGFLFVAVAPGGPVASVMVQNARGHLALAVSLIVVMNLLNTVLTPIGIWLMDAMPTSEGGGQVVIGMIKTILMFQVTPLAAAMGFRHTWPDRAIRLQPMIERGAKLLLIVVAIGVLATEIQGLKNLPWGLIAAVNIGVPISIAASWWLTPGNTTDKIAISLSTPYRSISVVLLLLAAWVRDGDAILAAMAYSGTMMWMCLVASGWMRKRVATAG